MKRWFLGLDSSTQSISAIVVDIDNGALVADVGVDFSELPAYGCVQGFLAHPDPLVRHADPLVWLAGLELLFERLRETGVDLGNLVAISGSGQQHGTVYLNDRFLDAGAWDAGDGLVAMVRPMLSRPTSPIWMDSSTSASCAQITAAAGGAAYVQRVTGSPAIERFSGPQIRRFFKQDPAAYAQTAVIHLVSSFMASVLCGESVGIDLGDGSGMNLLDLKSGTWDPAMLAATAPDLGKRLPPAIPASQVVGTIAPYLAVRYGINPSASVVAWSGDNPNSLIGVGGHAPGTAVISLGTSHTYFAAMTKPTVDPAGYGHVFGNPAGGYMSLICFKNGALAQEHVRERHGLDWKAFDACLLNTPAGNNGNMMLPYVVSEITPLVLEEGTVCQGSTAFEAGDDSAAAVRAVVEAQALRLRIHSAWIEDDAETVRVTGGASVSDPVCQILADVFEARIERLETGNSAGLGAAMRAAQGVGAADWATLKAAFCQPAAGKDLAPKQENVRIYREVLRRYRAFAEAHCQAATQQ